jgi:phospholipid transport system substrate-binding protein
MRLSRRLLLLAVISLPVVAGIWPPIGWAEPDPQAFIQTLAQQAISTVADRRLTDADREDRFRRLFVSAFDIPEIARFVLARYWRSAAPEQQQEFIKLFEDLQVLTWSQRFKGYQGETLQTMGAAKEGDRGWTVDSQILRGEQGPPIPVQWRLHLSDEGNLQVVDIVVEGVSMAITQRSDYAAMLQSNGGKLDALFSALRTKIDQLRAGP